MNISEAVKNQRLKNNWTQEQLAEILNVSRSTVSSWEVGRNYPDLETIVAISDLFEISLDELLRGDSEMVKKIDSKIKKGEYFFFIICLLILLIGLPILHQLFSNDVTAALLFFGYIFIIFLLAILLILWGLKGLRKYFK